MNSTQRKRLELSISHLIGLELWLIGELDLSVQELTHHFSSLQARMQVVQALPWPSDEDSEEGDDDFGEDQDSSERNQYG